MFVQLLTMSCLKVVRSESGNWWPALASTHWSLLIVPGSPSFLQRTKEAIKLSPAQLTGLAPRCINILEHRSHPQYLPDLLSTNYKQQTTSWESRGTLISPLRLS